MSQTRPETVSVWDIFVRVFHWVLVGAVTVAVLTGLWLGATWIRLHIIAGVLVAALVFARIVWGFGGTTYARFAAFVTSPKTVLAHLQELRKGLAPRHLGHNPLGAVMILALLGILISLVATGTLTLGGVFKTGPLAFVTTQDLGGTGKSVHLWLTYGLLALVALHIAGAIFESLRTHENLPAAMVTGRKERRAGDHVLPRRAARVWPVLAVVLLGLGGAFWAVTDLAAKPGLGVPQEPLDPTYADECSACHVAYHPSLLPQKSWSLLMADLSNHFGEDASLDPATTSALTDWLLAHAAESADTKPARVFHTQNPQKPFTLTQTPFWKTTHKNIPEDTFTRPPVYDNGNCQACHSDAASGRFFPGNISIPKETQK